ncbi:hypothetical protein LSTR_LSTR017278 [Laodelphax striatellus]|uniref:Uncharacterized protein n=1 Tax=Laodelphax striatellus TaxID=195883 RepID=A0A482XAU8_LAOST|nr:hypothetical protein LSTR_LSTR017278 [Laodelphax striatellus]
MSGGGGGGVDVAILIQEWLAGHCLMPTCVQSSWTVGKSKFGGRGLFATRDIHASELNIVRHSHHSRTATQRGPAMRRLSFGLPRGGDKWPPLKTCPGGVACPSAATSAPCRRDTAPSVACWRRLSQATSRERRGACSCFTHWLRCAA